MNRKCIINMSHKSTRVGDLFLVIFMLLFTFSCDLPWEPGPQPAYLESDGYTKKMNVLGVIRPGRTGNFPLSFVHLERSYDFYNIPDSLEINDANVQIFRHNGQTIIDTIQMVYTDADGRFKRPEYRSDELSTDSVLLAGQTFGILCERSGYPALSAQTTVPLIPEIVNDRIDIGSASISFSILRDERVKVYDVYMNSGNIQTSKRLIRPETGNTYVSIAWITSQENEAKLTIYAYDLFLSAYITFNIIIKPQTFQSTYSTGDNGYGCFGSINILEKTIRF